MWKLMSGSKPILLYALTAFEGVCLAELNDGHYDEEDDAKVLPIVLPIVLVVVIVCIIACCWQGKKCPCNKPDDKKKGKTAEQAAGDISDAVVHVNEKKAYSASKTAFKAELSNPPPDYSSVVGQRKKQLPGRVPTRDESHIPEKETSYKKTGHSSRSSGYDTEPTPNGRTDERYRVYDNRSHRNHERRERSNHKTHGDGHRSSGHSSRQHRQHYAGYA